MKVSHTLLLINAGVRYLKEYGYPNVNKENIFTDETYSAFFRKILLSNRNIIPAGDNDIEELIKIIDSKKKKQHETETTTNTGR